MILEKTSRLTRVGNEPTTSRVIHNFFAEGCFCVGLMLADPQSPHTREPKKESILADWIRTISGGCVLPKRITRGECLTLSLQQTFNQLRHIKTKNFN